MPVETISPATLKEWVQTKQAVVVDVREPAEFKAGHIEGATNVPLSHASGARLPECAGKKLVIHCQKGGRGTNACQKLLAENSDLQIYHLEGGISAWAQAGMPVKATGGYVLPLDRQVQLTVGSLVLASSLLGFFVNPAFMLLSAFFGAGLVFAGLSGICGLALVLARMPWNR